MVRTWCTCVVEVPRRDLRGRSLGITPLVGVAIVASRGSRRLVSRIGDVIAVLCWLGERSENSRLGWLDPFCFWQPRVRGLRVSAL